MGANAQTSVPLYVAAEVLTAADMNISAGTGVPVFATTVTRDAAFGGAGEKVLAEGQLAYIEASNIVQYYDGAAWATVGPSTAGGLVCVKAETSFSGTSITADNVFTSSYTNYLLMISAQSTTTSALSIRYRVGGVSASTNYNYQTTNADNTTTTLSQTLATTSSRIGTLRNATANLIYQYIYNPQLAVPTQNYGNETDTSGIQVTTWGGKHTTATAYDGIEILSATSATGTYTIYGYAKTV